MSAPETDNHAYLPDFCSAATLFIVLLVAELVAIAITIATGSDEFLTTLSKISLFAIWLTLSGSGLLCLLSGWLERFDTMRALLLAFGILLCLCFFLAEIAYFVTRAFSPVSVIGLGHNEFILRTMTITTIVIALAMRYLYVSSEWRRSIILEAQARVSALQALIRPHFLFNSMNTIASLTRSNPRLAEEAVEDLSELFRANLAANDDKTTLAKELEIAGIYERIEKLRLGDRLTVRWEVDKLPMHTLIPCLTIQPLLENAVYHGIESLPDGGEIVVLGRNFGNRLAISVENPVAIKKEPTHTKGNRMAMENIRQRFKLAYGRKGSVDVSSSPNKFVVTMNFPVELHDA